jgi:hypothetical protein
MPIMKATSTSTRSNAGLFADAPGITVDGDASLTTVAETTGCKTLFEEGPET